MDKFQAIVFDMDGLMVDSEPVARRGWEIILASYGKELDTQTYERMVGLRLEDSAALVADTFGLPITPTELADRKEAVMVRLRAAGLPVMPGLHALTDFLNAQQMPWAVATSSRRQYAFDVLAQLGLAESCQAVAAGNEVSHGKPAPDIYLLAASRLNIAPEHCLALEDSVPGGRAAVAAGMTLAAVPNGHTNSADFPFAHYVLNSLNDAIPLVKRNA
ncbi:MAG: HAD family phosphatase [Candidatus Promineifilaceae bacterium]